MLVTFCAYTDSIPAADAAQLSVQQRGANILGSVVGLDTSKYIIQTQTPTQDAQASYSGIIPQENVMYNLTSNGNNLKALMTFTNGNLQTLQVLETNGNPTLTKKSSASIVEMAKDFLNNYKTYTANPLFDQLNSTLSNSDQNKNLTKTSGNLVLQQTTYEGSTSFRWYYSCNGVDAEYSKAISLVFKNGFLSSFSDNWQFYNVGSTTVNLSEKDAIAIALETAKVHVSSLAEYGLDPKNISESNIRWSSLIFDDSQNANVTRSKDALELYPVWRVGVALDKWYGNMYGVEVDIWADTGQVRSIEDAWSNTDPQEGIPVADSTIALNSTAIVNDQSALINGTLLNSIGWTAIPVSVIAMIAAMFLSRRKLSGTIPFKRWHQKRFGIIICTFLLCILLFTTIAAVGASTQKAVIWGSEAHGSYNYPIDQGGPSWRKSSSEVAQQYSTANAIAGNLTSAGYNAYDNQGEHNTKSYYYNILSDIQTYSSSFNDRTVFIDFDHGNGNYANGSYPYYYHNLPQNGEFHFMFEDQNGTQTGNYLDNSTIQWHPEYGVYDNEIYDRSTNGTALLAFINACNSANIDFPGADRSQGMGNYGAIGLPFAFTHGRTVVSGNQQNLNIATQMSDNGYTFPDDGCQVFIGFWMGSAALSQNMPYEGGTHQYHEWVEKFFQYAATDGISINAALDHASLDMWNKNFADPSNPLHGFTAYWWNSDPAEGHMCVYGNGRIQLNGFGDDFSDGNYNGWTSSQGSWSVNSGKLVSQHNYEASLIRTNEEFTTDRHVRAQVKTISSGSNAWDVAWVMPKYIDNNKVYALIKTNGNVELSVIRNGQQSIWSNNSCSLNTYDYHTFDIDIVGTKAYLWIDGILRLTATSSYLDDFGGYSAVCTSYSTAEFDNITVIKQQSTINAQVRGWGDGGMAYESVFIDGQYAGQTWGDWQLPVGVHYISTDSYPDYRFHYFVIDNTYFYSDTVMYNFTHDSTVDICYYGHHYVDPGNHYGYIFVYDDGGGTTDATYLPGWSHGLIDVTYVSEPIPITAIPYEGYEFAYWDTSSGVSYDNPLWVEPSAGSVCACFRVLTSTLTVNATEGGTIDLTLGTYVCPQPTPVTLIAYPDSGNVAYWFLDGQLYRFGPSVTISMFTNHTVEARFVNSSLSQNFGNTEGLSGQSSLLGGICGQVFTCPCNSTAQSITAAVGCCITGYYVPVRYAIYDLRDCDLFGCRLIGQTEMGSVPSGGGWLTLNFEGVPPRLQANVTYLLVATGAGDPYGVWIASGSEDNANVTSQQYSFNQDLTYPQALDPPCEGSVQYSIYCTIDSTIAPERPFPLPASYSYISSIDSYNSYVSDPDNVVGSANNQQYATLFGTGDYSSIVGVMNENASGHIYLKGCSSSYLWWSGSSLTVYVSQDGENWVHVNDTTVESLSPGWIDCGVYALPFSYIRIDATSAVGCHLCLDSVRVYPV